MIEEEKNYEYWSQEGIKAKESKTFIYDYYNDLEYKKEDYSILLDKEYGYGISLICENKKVLQYSFLLTALSITLSKYISSEKITVGIPYYNINSKKVLPSSKVLPLTSSIDCEKSYKEYMININEKLIEAYSKQDKLNTQVLLKNNICTDVMELTPISISMKNLHDTRYINYICSSSKNEISFVLELLQDNSIKVQLIYNAEKFSKVTIMKLAESYKKVVKAVIENSNKIIKEIEVVSIKEKNQILYKFNDTKSEYPMDKTIHELFEEQVEKIPGNIAVVFEDKKLTYRELNERANSLARVLREKGVRTDSIVGIMVERSLEMIVGIMGILKAGGAYLPIDPNYPKERIEYTLKDSESKVLLSSNDLLENIEFDGKIIDLFNEELFTNESENLEKINTPSNLAYVIYTSGTTGNPKGVMIEHNQVNNFIKGMIKETNLDLYKNILCITTICFDIFGLETLLPLTKGLNIVVASGEEQIDGDKLGEVIKKNNIEIMQSTPSRLKVLLENKYFKESISGLKLLLIGGEEVDDSLVAKLHESINSKIYNVYGPSETTIWSTAKELKKNEKVTIGRPIINTKVYIVNKNNKLLPVGVAGELCISGNGLSRGYVNRTELTAEKFVDNPFESGTKMYKTGDLARWLPDGNIEFLGRIDNQVKIRGFRIELGEIENRLLQHKNIKEAAVLVKENKNSEKCICAYVVSDKDLKELDLKSYLKETLPKHMVPAYFIQLEKMPLTTNGKLDRRALPEPNLDIALTEYEAPRNKVEKTLAKIWSEVLGIEKVGINDNFFDLGGHSLKATVLMSKIHKELNKDVPLKELFKTPTIKELSKHIENTEENLYSRIEKVEEKEYYETSSAQKRMYILQQFDKGSVAYNMPAVFELQGKVNEHKIEETFRRLMQRHEALRTYFQTLDSEMIQKLQNDYQFELEHRTENGNIKDIINNFVRPFDLEKAPLFRVELVENKQKTYLLIDMHHIISDGLSMGILINEFTEIYGGKTLEPFKLQYKDFAAWQNNFLKSEEMKKQEEYWINKFNDEIPVLNMPTDYERPAMQSFEGNSVSFELNEEATLKLRKLTKETGTTMHMALLSAFNILLSKYSGQEDIVIGTPVAGRPHADLQNIMGMFVNTLALRNNPEGSKKYIDFLKEVKENSLKAYENQSYQLEALVEKLDIRRDTSRNPLFDVMFNMIDTVKGIDIKLEDTTLKAYNSESKIAKFDLTLNALENGNKLNFTIDYCSKLFKKETIERLSSHYVRILNNIANNVEIKLSEVDLLTEAEKNKILYEFNDIKVDYRMDKTIHELFEAQVKKNPDNIAVVFEDTILTYRELNQRANNIARVLRKKGVKADSIVGIMVERSIKMIVGIIGILKSGAAYLPLDPSNPKERIEYMLEDSGSKVLLSQHALVENIDFNGEIIDLSSVEINDKYAENLDNVNNPNSLAYVIYTSGTTGNPKGVMIEHRNLNNFINCFAKQFNYEFDSNDRVLSLTNYAFDVSVCEIFTTLIKGATLVINDKHKTFDIQEIVRLIIDNEITFTYIPPSLLNCVYEVLETKKKYVKLKKLLVGVESIKGSIINKFYNLNENIEIINGYGPTEATICSTFYKVTKNDKENEAISIGKNIGNTDIYILNNQFKIVPIGVIGEIYVSGSAVGRGYLNRDELTSEKFIDNPFKVETKMYKTGDLAKWLPNGNIEFIGRADNQVKIRGFRVEIGEIENKLLQHESIDEALVLVKENKEKEKYMCGYVVCKKELQALNLKNYLKQTLPEYMIPAYFVQLEVMPLTNNGKVDKKALPEPKLDANLIEYEAPRNEIEKILSKVWSEVLGIEDIGINDNFFELGGHSLKATMLMYKIHKELNKELPIKELFKSPTIKELVKSIEKKQESAYSKIEKIQKNEYYETSSAQKRMYMTQQLHKESIAYNMPIIFEISGDFNKDKIEESFSKIILRHEALRTYFEIIDGEIVQRTDEEYCFRLASKSQKGDIESIISNFISPFNLEKSPLFRVELIENQQKTYLFIDMHHIISDGISIGILIKEFIDLYNGKKLNDVPLQYKDFAMWQNNILKSEEMKQHEQYWLNLLGDEIPSIDLPYDYERPDVKSMEGDYIKFEIDRNITQNLKRFSKETETTIYMILLSAFNILLSKYSGKQDIVIGTPVAGRQHDDIENVIGVFVNILVLRNYVDNNKKYVDVLQTLKENLLKAYENQSYQFDTLVEKLDKKRNTSKNSLFDVMFNMVESVSNEKLVLGDASLIEVEISNKISKLDLSLIVEETNDQLKCCFEYCTKLFNKETIEIMAKDYLELLKCIVQDPEAVVSDIKLNSRPYIEEINMDLEDLKEFQLL